MKKLISFIILLTIIFILPHGYVNAQTTDNKEATYVGEIVPLRDFYKNEFAKSDDFKIDGKFIDAASGKEIPKEEWRLFVYNSISNTEVKITLVHTPSLETNEYNDINYFSSVIVKDFNPNIISNIKNNKLITIETPDINDASLEFKNSLDQKINGTVCYSYKDINNKIVKYSFIPYNKFINSGDVYNIYNIKTGYFKINDNAPLLSLDNLTLLEGQTHDINIDCKITDCVYTWESSDNTNISVNSRGVVKAESLGSAIITCKIVTQDGNCIKLNCFVEVK